jgi:protoporphyrinogen oxidase
MKKIVIIGGGMAGIAAARRLAESPCEVDLFERESRVGGLCRTERVDDFLFDYTGHLIHCRSKAFAETVQSMLRGQYLRQRRNAWIYSHGVYTTYPFQSNLHGLPIDLVVECVHDFAERHFRPSPDEPTTFEDWLLQYFGEGITRHFMIPFNSKVYQCHPRALAPQAGGRFVPRTDLRDLLRGALCRSRSNAGYNTQFYYPRIGGIERLIRALSTPLRCLHTGEAVMRIDPKKRIIETDRGRATGYDTLISTQPLPALVSMMAEVPQRVRRAAEALRHVSVLCFGLGVKGSDDGRHWVYVPEKQIPFHRLGFFSGFSAGMAPPDHRSLYVEVSHRPSRAPDTREILRATAKCLVDMKIIRGRGDIVVAQAIMLPYGYALFDHQRQKAVPIIHRFLQKNGIFSIGRFGAWEYSSMEDAFLEGTLIAHGIARGEGLRCR